MLLLKVDNTCLSAKAKNTSKSQSKTRLVHTFVHVVLFFFPLSFLTLEGCTDTVESCFFLSGLQLNTHGPVPEVEAEGDTLTALVAAVHVVTGGICSRLG